MADGFLKKTSENKTLTANPKFEKSFRFENTVIVWMASNELPSTSDVSHGMTRRAQVIHFGRTFAIDEQDHGLARSIIKSEMSGILCSAIAGLKRLRTRGAWDAPGAMQKEKKRWSSQGSPIAMWVHSSIRKSPDGKGRILVRDAYAHFRIWCQDQGLTKPASRPSFRKALESKGLQIRNGNGNKLTIYGIELVGIDIDGD